MALIVENGTGLSTAESFASVAEADAYFLKRANATWEALDDADDKEPALIKATDFMERIYGPKWLGRRVTETQALSFPRESVPRVGGWSYYATNEIPKEVKQACMELALRASQEDLYADLSPDDFLKSVSVGSISVEYKDGSPASKVFRQIDAILGPMIGGVYSGGITTAKVIRT